MFLQIPDQLVGPQHPVRLVAAAVEALDLSGFLAEAKAVEGHPGRPVTSPRLLLALWVYGIQQGVGEATELARRCQEEKAFQWLAGGVEVSHDRLSQFRVEHQGVLEQVFNEVLSVLLQHELVSLEQVAQDGTRVRASASAPSFRREPSLQECREQAQLHLKAVLAQADDPELTPGHKAAREAQARSYQQRVEAALEALAQQQARKKGADKDKVRASTTDADARVMKMADGGFRPAYNLQFAVAGEAEGGPRTIVGVEVTNQGTDAGSVGPMLEQIEQRTGQLPQHLLADGNHATLADIKQCADKGVEALISVPERMAQAGAQGDHSPEVEAWRQRMQTAEAKERYKARAGLVENVNAQVKGRYGLEQLTVRGLAKVKCVALLVALAHNMAAHGHHLVEALRARDTARPAQAQTHSPPL
ncbi:MAG TPA: IS1182 family transposase, partial [Chloroflexota bacterium]|nr:IS1182 family transposase [Chloroflexota bacterium]